MKRLLARVIARKAIPSGGGFADGIKLFTTPGELGKVSRESLEWIDDAIYAIRSAPDNTYGDDEEIIAGVIVMEVEKKLITKRNVNDE
jgi:hypothetical protein